MSYLDSLGWSEVANTKLRQVADPLDSQFAGINAWSSCIYDTLRNRLCAFGGGHGDGSNNYIYGVDMDSAPPAPLQVCPSLGPGGCSAYSCDGGLTPNARHTYDAIEYMPNIDAMFVCGGAPSVGGTPWLTDVWIFKFATSTWEYKNPTMTLTGASIVGDPGFIAAYDRNTQKVFFYDIFHLFSYTYATNTLAEVGGGGPFTDHHCTGCIDPVRRQFWIIGDGTMKVADISGGGSYTFVDRRSQQSGFNAVYGSGFPGLGYDETSDRLLAWIGGDSVYSLNLDTLVGTQITAYAGGPGSVWASGGTMKRWRYAPFLGAMVIENNVDTNIFVFRMTSTTPDTEAPTTPTNPSATAVSATQIDLSWTASTDNVGVSSYLIERCSGAACANFVQIVTVSETTYSNIGLSASTLYRYRIRATDAAGNLSSYSTIVEDTTDAPDTTPPTDPANLATTAVTYNRIDLAWDASTDAVGVANYRMERCSGAACTGFVQIGAPTTNLTWSDTSLTQNTTYRYRVRAVDAAGNFSGYSNIASGTTPTAGVLQVGSTKTYTTLAAAIAVAVNGDVIECDPETYQDDTCTITQTNITIRGVGGYAHFKWDTGDNTTATNDIPNGQGILKFQGSGTLENLEFSGAKVADNNGAGIRYFGANLTVRHCYFHNCQNGILGESSTPITGPTLTVEYSIFQSCGYFDGTYYAHNIYIGHMPRLIFRHNTSVDAIDGHCFKSRADINEVTYNYFSTKNSNGSFEIEFPNGHTAYVIGNLIVQGNNSDNSTMVSYGAEGLTNFIGLTTYHELYVVNNTFYNWRAAGCTYIQLVGSPSLFKCVNNAYDTGGGTFRSGTATTIVQSNNVALSDESWVDINGDFHLTASAVAAIDAGVSPGSASGAETYDLTPVYEYAGGPTRTVRSVVGALDVSAYEYGTPAPPQSNRLPFSRRT